MVSPGPSGPPLAARLGPIRGVPPPRGAAGLRHPYLLFDAGGALKLAGVAAFAGGFVMTLFEGFVQFLQAYVFTLLSALYIAGALADDH